MCSRKRSWPSLIREARAEAASRAALVLGAHGVLVALPVLPVGRVRDQVVERLACVRSWESVLPYAMWSRRGRSGLS